MPPGRSPAARGRRRSPPPTSSRLRTLRTARPTSDAGCRTRRRRARSWFVPCGEHDGTVSAVGRACARASLADPALPDWRRDHRPADRGGGGDLHRGVRADAGGVRVRPAGDADHDAGRGGRGGGRDRGDPGAGHHAVAVDPPPPRRRPGAGQAADDRLVRRDAARAGRAQRGRRHDAQDRARCERADRHLPAGAASQPLPRRPGPRSDRRLHCPVCSTPRSAPTVRRWCSSSRRAVSMPIASGRRSRPSSCSATSSPCRCSSPTARSPSDDLRAAASRRPGVAARAGSRLAGPNVTSTASASAGSC